VLLPPKIVTLLGWYWAINGRFCPDPPALPRIKDLGRTKTHDKTFAVLGGFWHSAA
jgi:hypothetical protein